MNFDSTFHCDTNSETLAQGNDEEFGDDHKAFQALIAKQNAENERLKQENHQLQLKIISMTTLQQDLQENIEFLETSKKQLEASINTKLQEAEDKNKIKINTLTTRLHELEATLVEKDEKNVVLQKELDEVNKKLSTLVIAPPVNEISFRNDILGLEDKIQELETLLSTKQEACLKLEEDLKETLKDLSELRKVYDDTKERLAEQNKILEATRDELTECRIELDNLKMLPADQASKGNSVFAELEDRRQKVYKTMMTYKQTYHEIKRTLQVKNNEIKALQAEKAALLTTLQNDRDETIRENANLIEKYKETITEFKFKLEDQRKKFQLLETQLQPIDDKYQYFLSALDAKKKENEELIGKIENASIQALIDEEKKCKINDNLRYWRKKAITKEAQLKAIECRLETEDSPIHRELLEIIQQENKVKNILDESSYSDQLEAGQINKYNDITSQDKNDFGSQGLKITEYIAEDNLINKNISEPRYTDLIDLSSPPINKESCYFNINSPGTKDELQAKENNPNYEKAKVEQRGILKILAKIVITRLQT
ncbi:protein Spindly-like [Chelonus insularis]|uniref:protein Spindly-like n=1 Tax=Chelonus insularis TaxID=460826 RepID=UPI001589778B|nr:protein Spindly-like [Chelonus insularis]